MKEIKTKDRPYSMEALYAQVGHTRQGFSYAEQNEATQAIERTKLLMLIKQWRELHPGMGARTLYYTMSNAKVELNMGINKFEQFIRFNGLNVLAASKKWPKTSDGKGRENYKNLTHGMTLNNINQLIVGDITYYWVDGKWHYIFTLKDAYSQRILSIIPSPNMEHIHAIACINDAIKIRGKEALNGCIHHTDNGSQYNADAYKKILNDNGMLISRAASCQENGSAEHVNHVAKNMYLYHWNIKTFAELSQKCKEFKKLNNEQRAIEQLGNISPNQFEYVISQLNIEERPLKTLYDFKQNKN